MKYSELSNDVDKQIFINGLYDYLREKALNTTDIQRFNMIPGEILFDIIVDFINYCDYKTFCNTIDILLENNYIDMLCACAINLYNPTGINIFEKNKYIINKCPQQHKTRLYEDISFNYIENANDINIVEIRVIYYMIMIGDINRHYLNRILEECIEYRDYNTIENFNMLRFRKQYIMFI